MGRDPLEDSPRTIYLCLRFFLASKVGLLAKPFLVLYLSRLRERTVLSIFREEVSRRIREREKERFVEIGGFMRDLREMKSRDKFKEVEERIK